jgi:hypothetical protein
LPDANRNPGPCKTLEFDRMHSCIENVKNEKTADGFGEVLIDMQNNTLIWSWAEIQKQGASFGVKSGNGQMER